MADLIVTEFISLDGVMEAPGGEPSYAHSGWVAPFMESEQLEHKFEEVKAVGSHLLGRVTYESFAGAWPQREGPFAERINSMPKFVVTGRPEEVTWENSTALTGDPIAAVAELRQSEIEPILVAGSRILAQALLRAGLVDELRLFTAPVVLGSGFRLFGESEETIPLELREVERFANGVVVNYYRPVEAA